MRKDIQSRLRTGPVLVADGATGTMLQAAGLPIGKPAEAWVLERPEKIIELHRAYVEAGSEIILTTTFGGTRPRLQASGLEAKVSEIGRRAALLAREAAGDGVYVAGDIGPTGEMMEPIGRLAYEAAVEYFAEQAQGLAEGGVDAIQIETMNDLKEAQAAVVGAQASCDLPIFCTFSFDTHGRTNMGVTPAQAAEMLLEHGVAAMGANCGHKLEDLLDILPEMREIAPDMPLIAKPNAGLPHMVKRQVVYDATPADVAEMARRYIELGVVIVGACCGSSPEYISAIKDVVEDVAG